jgi:hypothetical protein
MEGAAWSAAWVVREAVVVGSTAAVRDSILAQGATIAENILIKMNVPGVKFLHLLEE